MIITGSNIEKFRLCTLRAGVVLESKGLKRSKGSVSDIILTEYGISGTQKEQFIALTKLIGDNKEFNPPCPRVPPQSYFLGSPSIGKTTCEPLKRCIPRSEEVSDKESSS